MCKDILHKNKLSNKNKKKMKKFKLHRKVGKTVEKVFHLPSELKKKKLNKKRSKQTDFCKLNVALNKNEWNNKKKKL